jgi:pyrroloquinoline quinone biosynthesis protein D
MSDIVALPSDKILQLSAGTKLKHDPVRQADFLLLPERVVKLNDTAGAILKLVDGKRTLQEIVDAMVEPVSPDEKEEAERQVREFIGDLQRRGWLKR